MSQPQDPADARRSRPSETPQRVPPRAINRATRVSPDATPAPAPAPGGFPPSNLTGVGRSDIAGSIGPAGVRTGGDTPAPAAPPSRLPAAAVVDAPPARSATHLSREQILDATAGCLEDVGYDGTTIRRIARQLDCAVGSIYRYFDDKRALLAAVTQRRFEPVRDRSRAGAPLRDVADLYVMTAHDQAELYRLMFWLASVGQRKNAGDTANAPADVATVPAIVRDVIAAWGEQLGDRAAAESYWAQLHGTIMLGGRADRVPVPAKA